MAAEILVTDDVEVYFTKQSKYKERVIFFTAAEIRTMLVEGILELDSMTVEEFDQFVTNPEHLIPMKINE